MPDELFSLRRNEKSSFGTSGQTNNKPREHVIRLGLVICQPGAASLTSNVCGPHESKIHELQPFMVGRRQDCVIVLVG